MARFVTDFMVNRPDADQFIQYVTLDFLQKEGFKYQDYKGEMLWKKGTGALAAPQFLKVEHKDGHVHVEVWLRTVWLPGVHGAEMDLSGAWGFAIKEALRSKVNQLIGLLQQPQMVPGGPPQGQTAGQMPPQNAAYEQQTPPVQQNMEHVPPVQQGQPMQQNMPPMQQQAAVPVIVHNTSGSAVASLVLGLVSILGLLIPILGVVCSIIGIAQGVRGRRSTAKGLATAGLVVSIIFLVISIINWIMGAVMLTSYYMY